MRPLGRLEIEQRGVVIVGRIGGEVDVSNAGELGARLYAAVPNEASGLVVDLSGTTYLDSSGVHLLLMLAERLRSRQQGLRVVVPEDSRLRRVLLITEADRAVPLDREVDQAVERLLTAP